MPIQAPIKISPQEAREDRETVTPAHSPTDPPLSPIPVREKSGRRIHGRVASRDLRIGLNLLGENGRLLLAEYIKTKTLQPAC